MKFPASAVFAAVTPLEWALAGGSVGFFFLLGIAVRTVLFSILKKWFAKTETKIDDIILEASQFHVLFWFLLIGVHYGLMPLHFPEKVLLALHRTLVAAWGISLTLWASKIVGESVLYLTSRTKGEQGASSLIINLSRISIVALGGLFILSNLGISIAPLLTALGVGSLAVALALQDTLSNIFAGFYILVSRQIRPGDYIRLDSGQEGHVMDVGWRSTRIRELPDNVIIVPNSKMAQAIVTNYEMPLSELACPIQMGVAYESDLEKVERVTLEVARDVQKTVQGAVAGFEPVLRFHTFADSSINFVAVLRVKNFTDKGLVTHEFMKRVQKRYQQEKIDIPFPQRVLHWDSSQPVPR